MQGWAAVQGVAQALCMVRAPNPDLFLPIRGHRPLTRASRKRLLQRPAAQGLGAGRQHGGGGRCSASLGPIGL